jgi:hypothetical protein
MTQAAQGEACVTENIQISHRAAQKMTSHTYRPAIQPMEALAALDNLVLVQSKLPWGIGPERLAEILICKAKMLELVVLHSIQDELPTVEDLQG